jgi:hypothetical protein
MATLECRDDPRRVADRLAVEHEHRERRAAGQLVGDPLVASRDHGAANVR